MANYVFTSDIAQHMFDTVLNKAISARSQLQEAEKKMEECADKWFNHDDDNARKEYRQLKDSLESLEWATYFVNWYERHETDHELVIGLDNWQSDNKQFPDFVWCANNDQGRMVINGGLINHGDDKQPRYLSHT